jgi:hypothetical protein
MIEDLLKKVIKTGKKICSRGGKENTVFLLPIMTLNIFSQLINEILPNTQLPGEILYTLDT